MAAEPTNCLGCGDRFVPQTFTQHYCLKPECRKARNAAKVRDWRATTAYRDSVRHERAIERGRAA